MHGRSFLVGDFTKFAYLYCIWLLTKKLLLTAILQHIDGAPNAALAVSLQALDTIALVTLLPFNDVQVASDFQSLALESNLFSRERSPSSLS